MRKKDVVNVVGNIVGGVVWLIIVLVLALYIGRTTITYSSNTTNGESQEIQSVGECLRCKGKQ